MFKTQGLSKNFGRLTALSNVSFQVERGEIFGIAGPNGAGKSTIFNVVTGIYPPSDGRVFFEGRDITRWRPHQICQIGIARTFQIPTTFHTMSVYDNIRVGATFGAKSKDHVDEIINILGLEECLHMLAKNLDLYTTKMVMLGAALATNCKLLLLDEPMAGLSIVEINSFIELIQKINKEMKKTIIIIEHLLDVLINITSRMMILHDGKVLYLGSSKDVTSDRRVVEVYLGGRSEMPHA